MVFVRGSTCAAAVFTPMSCCFSLGISTVGASAVACSAAASLADGLSAGFSAVPAHRFRLGSLGRSRGRSAFSSLGLRSLGLHGRERPGFRKIENDDRATTAPATTAICFFILSLPASALHSGCAARLASPADSWSRAMAFSLSTNWFQ